MSTFTPAPIFPAASRKQPGHLLPALWVVNGVAFLVVAGLGTALIGALDTRFMATYDAATGVRVENDPAALLSFFFWANRTIFLPLVLAIATTMIWAGLRLDRPRSFEVLLTCGLAGLLGSALYISALSNATPFFDAPTRKTLPTSVIGFIVVELLVYVALLIATQCRVWGQASAFESALASESSSSRG